MKIASIYARSMMSAGRSEAIEHVAVGIDAMGRGARAAEIGVDIQHI
jgi:hypothetical protein